MPKTTKVISGGQTGGDRGGLDAAKDCHIETGGTAPKGYRIDGGYDLSLRDYGLVEHHLREYPPRTECNVKDSDVTIIFGDDMSPGCKLTKRLCRKHGKNFLLVRDFSKAEFLNAFKALNEQFKDNIVINIAGNRESSKPGIENKTRMFLVVLFTMLEKE